MEKKELDITTIRASIDGASINVEDRSFDVVIATETPIPYFDYRYKDAYDGAPERYNEVLLCNSDAIEVQRLDVGIPLFPSHWQRDSLSQLGITTEYDLSGGRCSAKIKLGARADEALWSDIQNGISKTVSIGVKIFEATRSEIGGSLTYTATKWSPMHVALAPEPADINCNTVRSSDTKINNVVVETKKDKFLDTLTNKFKAK